MIGKDCKTNHSCVFLQIKQPCIHSVLKVIPSVSGHYITYPDCKEVPLGLRSSPRMNVLLFKEFPLGLLGMEGLLEAMGGAIMLPPWPIGELFWGAVHPPLLTADTGRFLWVVGARTHAYIGLWCMQTLKYGEIIGYGFRVRMERWWLIDQSMNHSVYNCMLVW